MKVPKRSHGAMSWDEGCNTMQYRDFMTSTVPITFSAQAAFRSDCGPTQLSLHPFRKLHCPALKPELMMYLAHMHASCRGCRSSTLQGRGVHCQQPLNCHDMSWLSSFQKIRNGGFARLNLMEYWTPSSFSPGRDKGYLSIFVFLFSDVSSLWHWGRLSFWTCFKFHS